MCEQVVARSGVSARHSFVKALLHVWCETERTAMLMQREYAGRGGESSGKLRYVLMLLRLSHTLLLSPYNVFVFFLSLFSAFLPICHSDFLPFLFSAFVPLCLCAFLPLCLSDFCLSACRYGKGAGGGGGCDHGAHSGRRGGGKTHFLRAVPKRCGRMWQ